MISEVMRRMEIRSALEITGDDPKLIDEYLSTFPLPLLQRILINLDITTANTIFPEIINDARKIIGFIRFEVLSDKKNLLYIK